MAQHNDTGKWGEELAAEYLNNHGYDILERNWRLGHHEVDIIARQQKCKELVFVEVKTRSSDIITKPQDAVDLKKIRSIGMCANAYVKSFNITEEIRFDIISIVGTTKETAQIEHIDNAFNPCMAYR